MALPKTTRPGEQLVGHPVRQWHDRVSRRVSLGYGNDVAGSLTVIFLAGQLIKAFKGKGLVDAVLVADSTYVAACAAVGIVIAIGGLISARRVAETMSQRITKLNHGQGFTANALAGLIIIGASKFGMPVSTTHVSCGALFGIGTVNGTARWRTIATILVAWVTTLPLGGLLGYGAFTVLR